MALPLYLAQTAAEMAGNPHFGSVAYMSCRFSPCSTGLSNLPRGLPEGSLLLLDDSTPMDGHDPTQILKQLTEVISRHRCIGLLLDFQRQNIPGQQELASLLSRSLPCPVGVSEMYAAGLSGPVFLPPVPPDRHLSEYLAPWNGREIWLEAALEGIILALTESGCTAEVLPDLRNDGLTDEKLHCHYAIETSTDSAIFRLWRTRSDLEALLSEAESRGVTMAIGLWQELETWQRDCRSGSDPLAQ